jgi:hypothetical protein
MPTNVSTENLEPMNTPDKKPEIEKRFDKALKSIRARAKKLNITQEDIEAEIRAVREKQAHGG